MVRTHLLVVEQRPLVVLGILASIVGADDVEVVGVARSALTGLELVRELRPDIAILDVRLPDLTGLELAHSIKAECPCVEVILLSDEPVVEAALARARVAAQISKLADPSALIEAIRRVRQSPAAQTNLVRSECVDALTPRERETLRLLVTGYPNRRIAAELRITENTVESHVRRVLHKLGVKRRQELRMQFQAHESHYLGAKITENARFSVMSESARTQ